MTNEQFNAFIRARITELLAAKKKSEHRASIELGKGDSYIRSITNGISSPSLKGLYDIIMYFEMTPSEFFAPMENKESLYQKLCERIHDLSDEDMQKVDLFLDWIRK